MSELPCTSKLINFSDYKKLYDEITKTKSLIQLYLTKMSIHTTSIPRRITNIETRLNILEESDKIKTEYLENIYKRLECIEKIVENVVDHEGLFDFFKYNTEKLMKHNQLIPLKIKNTTIDQNVVVKSEVNTLSPITENSD